MRNFYHLLTGATHPLALTAPLYNLPGGTKDELDALTGVETHRLGVKVFDGTEAWAVSSLLSNNYQFYVTQAVTGTNIKYLSMTACTHAKHCLLTNRDALDSDNCVWAGTLANAEIAFMFNKETCPFASDTAWKVFLAAQYAAGTPVTVVYELATPVTHNNDPLTIPLYPPNCSISVNDGALDVEYLSGGEVVAKSGERINLVNIDPETNLQTCTVYGVGEQAGAPTPDNPMPIPAVSAPVITVGDIQTVRTHGRKRTFRIV